MPRGPAGRGGAARRTVAAGRAAPPSCLAFVPARRLGARERARAQARWGRGGIAMAPPRGSGLPPRSWPRSSPGPQALGHALGHALGGEVVKTREASSPDFMSDSASHLVGEEDSTLSSTSRGIQHKKKRSYNVFSYGVGLFLQNCEDVAPRFHGVAARGSAWQRLALRVAAPCGRTSLHERVALRPGGLARLGCGATRRAIVTRIVTAARNRRESWRGLAGLGRGRQVFHDAASRPPRPPPRHRLCGRIEFNRGLEMQKV